MKPVGGDPDIYQFFSKLPKYFYVVSLAVPIA